MILSGLELDRLTVVDSKVQSSSTVSMLHVLLLGEALVLLVVVVTGCAASTVVAEGPREAFAAVCVCTARCLLGCCLCRCLVYTLLSGCLPEHEAGQGPRTKLSLQRPTTREDCIETGVLVVLNDACLSCR